jgi:RNA polymerase sigma-70 factor (ECF subfamily)
MSEGEIRFVQLYQSYGKLIHAYCARRTTSSQAADAVSEVFLVTWKRIDDVPQGDSALPWLYAVAYRVISHQWRHNSRSLRLVERLKGLPAVEAPSPEVVLVRRAEAQAVVKAASKLKPIEQEILRLTLWEELSHSDVAVVLGLEPGVVKQRAFRARRNLAQEYQKLNKDPLPPAALKGGAS